MLAWLVAACGSAPPPPAPARAGAAGPNGSRVFTAAEVRALPKRTTALEVDGACVTFEGVALGDAFAAAGVPEAAVRAGRVEVLAGGARAPLATPSAAFAPLESAGCGEAARWALLAWGRAGEPPEGLRFVIPGPPDLVLEGAHVISPGGLPDDLAAFEGVRRSGGLAVVGPAVP